MSESDFLSEKMKSYLFLKYQNSLESKMDIIFNDIFRIIFSSKTRTLINVSIFYYNRQDRFQYGKYKK